MIVDIPTQMDHETTCDELFVTAWKTATELLNDRMEAEFSNESVDLNEYLSTIQVQLRSAIALVHQGVEFYLKGLICGVSPYLLIAGTSPQNWPRKCAEIDVSFSNFRSIDAQDLVKVVNTVCKNRLSDKFVFWFEQLRVRRNRITHSVHNSELLKEIDVLRLILDASEFLKGHNCWMNTRKSSLLATPAEVLSRHLRIEEEISAAYNLGSMQREFIAVVDSLLPNESKLYFDFDKKRRRHICENCLAIREKEYFFELKNLEEYYCATAITLSTGEAFCLICREEGQIGQIGSHMDAN